MGLFNNLLLATAGQSVCHIDKISPFRSAGNGFKLGKGSLQRGFGMQGRGAEQG